MIFRIYHPQNRDIFFLYNEDLPAFIRVFKNGDSKTVLLTHQGVNAQDFFYCMVKAKCIEIENKYKGYAFIEGKRMRIQKPYDCKWAINKILDIPESNPLIISNPRERQYLWLYSDEEMRISGEELEALHHPTEMAPVTSTAPENFHEEGTRTRKTDFTDQQPMNQGFDEFRNRMKKKRQIFEEESETMRKAFENRKMQVHAFHSSMDSQIQSWSSEKSQDHSDLFDSKSDLLGKRLGDFSKKHGQIVHQIESTRDDVQDFPADETKESVMEKSALLRQILEDRKKNEK